MFYHIFCQKCKIFPIFFWLFVHCKKFTNLFCIYLMNGWRYFKNFSIFEKFENNSKFLQCYKNTAKALNCHNFLTHDKNWKQKKIEFHFFVFVFYHALQNYGNFKFLTIFFNSASLEQLRTRWVQICLYFWDIFNRSWDICKISLNIFYSVQKLNKFFYGIFYVFDKKIL